VDNHGWYSLIGPYIGYDAWASQLDLTRSFSDDANVACRKSGIQLKIHECPSDIGLQTNEWDVVWARTLGNYVVNCGNRRYGQEMDFSVNPAIPDPLFRGSPFVGGEDNSTGKITDGTSKTLMMSENWVLLSEPGWGGAFSDHTTSLGGQTFSGWNPPNSRARDQIQRGLYGGIPAARQEGRWRAAGFTSATWPEFSGGDANETRALRLTARSKHKGGVNASRCDGSVSFYGDSINAAAWAALTSARGGPNERQVQ
jgi:prepilin-type processing-associated H-X9-DG protein